MLTLRHKLFCLMLAIISESACAGNLNGELFEFYGQEQPLTEVLTAIATHSGLGVRVSENIAADFSGLLKQRNSFEALNYLAATYDLVWYNDGATLFVDPINAMQSRLFQLDQVAARQVKNTMMALSIFDERFEWRSLNQKAILMVSGPPRYLALVEDTITLLNAQYDTASADTLGIKIFKLNHASASDRRVNIRDEEVVLPGVASLLKGLLQGALQVEPSSEIKDNARFSKLSGDELNSSREKDTYSNSQMQTLKGGPHPQAAIYPDPGTNSVIIQDYSSRLMLYSDLIAELDTPRQQLEISLLIIDLTANSLLDIGVNWNVATKGKGKGLLDLILPGTSEGAGEQLIQTNADFLATVTALETEGKARVTSRPAVVTENGMEASLDNNETFFVRVQGERVASLEQITFGTLLQVVPRVVNDTSPEQTPFISLDVKIEDANRLVNGAVDSLPSIRNTEITTRSLVPNGGSLLIGGYYREAATVNDNGIPLLRDIPLFGNLFQRSGDSSSQLVRLFMLSARILPINVLESRPEYVDKAISHTQHINQLSDLSNFNSEIKRLSYKGECESAFNARQRRNRYNEAKMKAQILPCQTHKGNSKYRVIPR